MTIAISELEKFHKVLQERHAELSRQLTRVAAKELFGASTESDENMQGSDRETERRKTEELNLVRKRLQEIEIALNRIKDGTFGICEDCEKTIPIKRLEAYPNTTRCVACKEKQERANKN